MNEQEGGADNALRREAEAFLTGFRSLAMATVDIEGYPEASYAPYVADDEGNLYVFVSGLSRHTRNLAATRHASVLFIEDESRAQNIFARRRLTYTCVAEPVERDTPEFGRVLDLFEDAFGAIILTLRGLADFRLFCLRPSGGRYVRGFGQAFHVHGGAVEPITPGEIGQMSERATPQDVVDFWFSDSARPLWFRSTAAFDQQIRERFLATWRLARDGALQGWTASAQGALALILVLDQFPLNLFRGTPKSFCTEAAAREAARRAIHFGFDSELDNDQKVFLYLPFMHSEDPADQDRAVELCSLAGLQDALKWAEHHRELIRRFGRFPHRNGVLGRISTPEEQVYLSSDDAFLG